MSYHPAGAEDSDSDDEGFYMGSSYSVNTDRDKYSMNGDVKLNSSVSSQKSFPAMPAGAESDDEDSEGFERGSAPFRSVASSSERNDRRRTYETTNDSVGTSFSTAGASGLGRGRGQLHQRGRGRGGFPKPPASYSNRGKATRRSNFSPNNSKEIEARKASLSLAVDDLRIAIQKGNLAAVQKFFDNGIDIDIQLKSGWTSLMLAASTASSDLVELLINRGANVNFHKEMYTVLMATCAASVSIPEEQVLKCVELLLEKNARVNVYDKYHMSPLMYAARDGRVTLCEKLLEHGAEINKQEMRGWTSLSFAASRGHGRVVRTLLDHGADPKIYSSDGQTASDIAYSSDYPRISDIISLAASGKQSVSTEVALEAAKPTSYITEEDSSLSYGSLEVFLVGHELKYLLPKFQEHKVTFDGLLTLTEKELDQMGITQVGVRTKILDAIREVHKKEWDVSSLQAIEKHSLSAAEVTVILANVSRHLTFIRSSVSYVRKHLNTVNEPLEFVQDVTEAEGMSLYCIEATKASQDLNDELKAVKTQILQINSKISNTAPDLIVDEKPQSAQHSSHGGLLLAAGLATVALGAIMVHRMWHNT